MRHATLFLITASAIGIVFARTAGLQAGIIAGETVGVGIGSDPTTNWTIINSFSPTGALDLSDGSPISGVNVTLIAPGGGINDLSGTTHPNDIPATDAPSSILDFGAYAYDPPSEQISLSFSGLDDSLTYDLEVYSLSTYYNTPDTPYINGIATVWPSGFGDRESRANQTTGAFFDDLTTDGSGNLTFAIDDPVNFNPVITGLKLVAVAPAPVPEPSSIVLVLLGGIGFVSVRRRKFV